MGDALVAQPGQMGDGEPDAPLVVDRDRRQAVVVREPVHQHHRQVRPGCLGQHGVVEVRRREDETVHVPRPHLLEDNPLPLAVPVGVAEQRDITGGGEPVLDAPHDRREQRIVQVGDEHPDGVRAPGPQAARHRVRPVAEEFRGLKHPESRVLPDKQPRLRVQRARRRGRMHSGPGRNVPQGYRRFRHRQPRSALQPSGIPPQRTCASGFTLNGIPVSHLRGSTAAGAGHTGQFSPAPCTSWDACSV